MKLPSPSWLLLFGICLFAACTTSSSREAELTQLVAVGYDSIPVLDSVPLDSCLKLDALTRPRPRCDDDSCAYGNFTKTEGAWFADSLTDESRYTMLVPRIIKYGNGWPGGYPGFRYGSGITVAFSEDSTARSLPQILHLDKSLPPDEFGWTPERPRAVRVNGEIGALADNDCGDCFSRTLYVKRGTTVAAIQMNEDDREDPSPGLSCRVLRTAMSFRWKDP